MKQVQIAAYGAPEEVARLRRGAGCRRARRRARSCSTCSPFPINPADLSFCRGNYRLTPTVAGDAGGGMRRPGQRGRRRRRRHPGRRSRQQHAARELDAAPPHRGRGRDPAAGRARPRTGGDAADQPGDGAVAARGPCHAEARRLGDPERRQFGGRPAPDRARQGARHSHGQCRAARRCRRRAEERSAPMSCWPTGRISPERARDAVGGAPIRLGIDAVSGDAPAGASPTASRDGAVVVNYGSMSGEDPVIEPAGAERPRRQPDRLHARPRPRQAQPGSRCARSTPISRPNCATAP